MVVVDRVRKETGNNNRVVVHNIKKTVDAVDVEEKKGGWLYDRVRKETGNNNNNRRVVVE